VHIGEKRNTFRVFVGIPEGKRPLGKPRHGWENDIKMDHGEIGRGVMDWIHVTHY
jgi:hypothetical protein